jgi:hypothetical protein
MRKRSRLRVKLGGNCSEANGDGEAAKRLPWRGSSTWLQHEDIIIYSLRVRAVRFRIGSTTEPG